MKSSPKLNFSLFQSKSRLHFWIKHITLGMLLGILVFVTSRGMFDTRMSDFSIGSFTSILIYFISFKVLRESAFFKAFKKKHGRMPAQFKQLHNIGS